MPLGGPNFEPPKKRSRLSCGTKISIPSTSEKNCGGGYFLCKDKVPTLLDLCAKITAENVAFQRVEERCSPIPEPVQRRILFWSFPRDEMHIRMYSSPCCGPSTSSSRTPVDDLSFKCVSTSTLFDPPSSFTEGLRLLENNCVEETLQIGFHLSGTVRSLSVIEGERKAFRVSVSFDRCKITAVKCSCDSRDIHWCQHVVALSLNRMRFPLKTELRLPISETLYQMDRDQLQKFVQYLIAEHHTDVLPTAQGLADEIMKPDSHINNCDGAPDPTAGPCADGEHSWFLDEGQVCAMVRTCLSQSSSMEQLHSLFSKVREMLRQRDENGPRLLRLLTEQFLNYPWLGSLRSTTTYQTPILSEKCQQLWDQLGALWVCVVLNPFCRLEMKSEWRDLLKKWISLPTCPPENGSPTHTFITGVLGGGLSNGGVSSNRSRTVFHRAVDACRIQWVDRHLRRILNCESSAAAVGDERPPPYTTDGLPMWHEHVPTACARVESLRAHGYKNEAVSLAVAIVRSVKYWQQQHLRDFTCAAAPDGWIGHPLDPVNCLFDTLLSASEIQSAHSDIPSSPRPPFKHVSPSLNADSFQSYLTLATEVALIALGQQRKMPPCAYAKQKAVRQEENLIQKLKSLTLDPVLLSVLREQAVFVLEGGSWSGFGSSVQPDTMPIHLLACYLFETLLSHDCDLAYKVGLRALRIPVRMEDDAEDGNILLGHPSAWTIPFSHVENQQSHLANCMLLASKGNVSRLKDILEAIHTHMRSSSLVYRLAHEIHREASTQTEGSPDRQNLLHTALELGLQVLRMTVGSPSWSRREMVRWLVTCASTLSLDAVVSILRNWRQLFTPTEACGTVAQMLAVDTVVLQLKLDLKQQELLAQEIHKVALECALQNPPSCALHALTLCESSAEAFDHAYRIVVDAARTSCMPAPELFNIARHMEHRNHTLKAYEMAVLGLANTHIGCTDEASALIQDVYWATYLSQRLGRYQLANVITYIVKNVKCAAVLSYILTSFCVTPTGGTSKRKLSVPGLTADPKLAALQVERTHLSEPPFSQLLEAAIAAYVHTIHSRLTHISPRHYSEFLDFLTKAEVTFNMAHDGGTHFSQLLENLRLVYKGKKKLMALITHRFRQYLLT